MVRLCKAAAWAALALLGAGGMASAQPRPPRSSDFPPSPPPPPEAAPDVLAGLEPGLWEFKDVDHPGKPERRCIPSLRELFQPAQPGLACRHFLAENRPGHAAVAYDCAARGQGRTTLRVETRRLLRIESHGVAEGRPFAVRLEARRVGACLAARR